MHVDFLLAVFRANADSDFLVWNGRVFPYSRLLADLDRWQTLLEANGVAAGTAVAIEADFSPNAIALFLALMEKGCILIPVTTAIRAKVEEFLETSAAEVLITLDSDDNHTLSRTGTTAENEFYAALRAAGRPGLVLFSSGSTGKSKAAVHDLLKIVDKYRTQRKCLRSITFLLYDHIGGINTMFYILSNAGCIVTTPDRSADTVLRTIQEFRVELLPTSPTFINLILISEAWKRYDLGSLKIVSYGTEPMPESTLKRFHGIFPDIRLVQTYGLSEVGILQSQSKSSDSLWVRIGGDGFETRVVDNILHIKSRSAMLGYLNAPSPFTADGWFVTGDLVETDGEYFRILGRKSELINVGGQKVYPAEVESVIQEVENVAEVTVFGEKNPLMGNIVCAKVSLITAEDNKEAIRRIKKHCAARLELFKVPVRITIAAGKLHSERSKKIRNIDLIRKDL